jgi:hypothetical protein
MSPLATWKGGAMSWFSDYADAYDAKIEREDYKRKQEIHAEIDSLDPIYIKTEIQKSALELAGLVLAIDKAKDIVGIYYIELCRNLFRGLDK